MTGAQTHATAPGAASVLVVDDEPSVRVLLERLLRRAGYAVTLAADGPQAMDLLGQRRFDVVVTDKNLPGVDGVEVARFARQRAPGACIVIISGYPTAQSADASRDFADAYFTKPFAVAQFGTQLAALRERRRALSARPGRGAGAGVPAAAAPVALLLAQEGLRERLEGVACREGHPVQRLEGGGAIARLAPGTVLVVDDESCSSEVYRAIWSRQAADPSFQVVLLSPPDHPHASINAVSLGAARLTPPLEEGALGGALRARRAGAEGAR